MRQTFEQICKSFGNVFSGAFLASDGNGTIYAYQNGLANRDFGIPNTIDTKFDTASITKTFTAVAILHLCEKGLLSLEDKITERIDLSGTSISKDVTLRHLLTHTSGIPDDADEESGEDYSALFVDKPNYSIRCCKDFLPQFAYKKPYFKPGEGVRYNNCAFVLLGLAMEAATGADCRDIIRKAVFEPCGMEYTSFCAKDEVEANRAEGYFAVKDEKGDFLRWRKNIYSYPPVGTPDGGAYTTVGDLERFFRALQSGYILSPSYTEELFRPQSRFPKETKYGIWETGYAFEFLRKNGAIICMYKEGGNAGVDGITAYFSLHDISVHIFSNQEGPFWELYRKIKDALL